jgi:heme-degrading monooxygenase HmoA
MITVVWEYQVKVDRIAEFKKIYSPEGNWGELFKNGNGFVKTRLIQSPDHSNLFITIDQWESLKDYKAFLSQWKTEYEKLDKQCEELIEYENYLGSFDIGLNDEEQFNNQLQNQHHNSRKN